MCGLAGGSLGEAEAVALVRQQEQPLEDLHVRARHLALPADLRARDLSASVVPRVPVRKAWISIQFNTYSVTDELLVHTTLQI